MFVFILVFIVHVLCYTYIGGYRCILNFYNDDILVIQIALIKIKNGESATKLRQHRTHYSNPALLGPSQRLALPRQSDCRHKLTTASQIQNIAYHDRSSIVTEQVLGYNKTQTNKYYG